MWLSAFIVGEHSKLVNLLLTSYCSENPPSAIPQSSADKRWEVQKGSYHECQSGRCTDTMANSLAWFGKQLGQISLPESPGITQLHEYPQIWVFVLPSGKFPEALFIHRAPEGSCEGCGQDIPDTSPGPLDFPCMQTPILGETSIDTIDFKVLSQNSLPLIL